MNKMINAFSMLTILGKFALLFNIAAISKIVYDIVKNYETFWTDRSGSVINILFLIALIYFLYGLIDRAIKKAEAAEEAFRIAYMEEKRRFEEWLNSDDPTAKQLREIERLEKQFSHDLRSGNFMGKQNEEEEKDDNEKDG